MEDLNGKFIGLDEIEKIEEDDKITYLGGKRMKIYFKGGKTKELPESTVVAIMTDRSIDLAQLRDKVVNPIVAKTLAILLDAEIKVEDIEYFKNKLTMSVNNNMQMADAMVWGSEFYDRTLGDVHRILTKNNGPTNNSKQQPKGDNNTGSKSK